MDTIQEIKSAIERLPPDAIAHLRDWIEKLTAPASSHAAGDEGGERPPANQGMLEALARIKEIHTRMNPKPSDKDYVREGREGAMYECDGDGGRCPCRD